MTRRRDGGSGPKRNKRSPARKRRDEVTIPAVPVEETEPVVPPAEGDEAGTTRADLLELLVVRIGTEMFGLPVGEVEEVLEIAGLRVLPESDRALLGLTPLRGRLLPVYAASSVLGAVISPEVEWAMVLRGGDRRVAVAIDDAAEVIAVAESELRRSPARGTDERIVRGVVLYGSTLLTVLDANALASRFAAISEPERA